MLCISISLFSQTSVKYGLDENASNLLQDLNNSNNIEKYFDVCKNLEKQGNFEKANQYYQKLRKIAESKNNSFCWWIN